MYTVLDLCVNFIVDFFKNSVNLLIISSSDFSFLFIQILLIYSLIQIFHETNILRLVLNILILLLILSTLLMIFQLELFACFLIVSEILLFSFIYAYLYNLNLSNKLQNSDLYIININNLVIFFIISVIFVTNNSWNLLITNINDLYTATQRLLQIYTTIAFSDLIFLFNFFLYIIVFYMYF